MCSWLLALRRAAWRGACRARCAKPNSAAPEAAPSACVRGGGRGGARACGRPPAGSRVHRASRTAQVRVRRRLRHAMALPPPRPRGLDVHLHRPPPPVRPARCSSSGATARRGLVSRLPACIAAPAACSPRLLDVVAPRPHLRVHRSALRNVRAEARLRADGQSVRGRRAAHASHVCLTSLKNCPRVMISHVAAHRRRRPTHVEHGAQRRNALDEREAEKRVGARQCAALDLLELQAGGASASAAAAAGMARGLGAHLLRNLLDAQLVARQRQRLALPLVRRGKGLGGKDANVSARHELQRALDAGVQRGDEELGGVAIVAEVVLRGRASSSAAGVPQSAQH